MNAYCRHDMTPITLHSRLYRRGRGKATRVYEGQCHVCGRWLTVDAEHAVETPPSPPATPSAPARFRLSDPTGRTHRVTLGDDVTLPRTFDVQTLIDAGWRFV